MLLSGLHCANLLLKSIRTIHDNLCDFKIERPPYYLPDLKEGAYLFGVGGDGVLRIKNAPHVKLWVGEMNKFGLPDLMNTVDSKLGTTLTVRSEFTGMVFKYDIGETVTV